MHLNDILKNLQEEKGHLCLHIRAQLEKIPTRLKELYGNQAYHFLVAFFKETIDACADHIMGIEFDVASFQTFRHDGVHALEVLCRHAREKKIFVIYGGELSTSTNNPHVNMNASR